MTPPLFALAGVLLVCGAVALSDETTGGDIFAAVAFVAAGMMIVAGLFR